MTSKKEVTTEASRDRLVARFREHHLQEPDEVDLASDVTAILTQIVHDESPKYSLQDVAYALATLGASSSLDALHVIPLLLDYQDGAADEILALLAECGNAKETLMSVQESFEKLYHDLRSDDTLREERLPIRVKRLLYLCIGAIPRLKLRKRTASETLRPLFGTIAPVLELLQPSLQKTDGRIVVQLLCNLLSSTVVWASQRVEADLSAVKELCRRIFSSTVENLSSFLELDLARQSFEAINPRLSKNKTGTINSETDALLQQCIDVALVLSYSIDELLHEGTTASLVLLSILLSRTSLQVPSPNSVLTAVFPVLVAALQSGICVDSCLNILLHVLHPPNRNVSMDIDPDLLAPLSSTLGPIASTSPDPVVRHIAFRILGTFISRAPALERMSLLRELLVESPFPSLRVASVGLLKNAVMEALAATSKGGVNPFASSALLRTFGYIVLRPDPPELFSKPPDRASLVSFLEMQEPRRLVECLGFYYVLLLSDTRNLTGVREQSHITSVEREFLTPLRNTLHTWAELEEQESVGEHDGMALASLEISLERIDEAYEKLGLRPL
ncbi:uncharacterized protein FOMMEDRAFT_118567 [Fomitiporia mediterranea MF3/22]|uniref:uncharacterized protein n=1 Tax=Fomitiporia mediterranea (strain MF3/22) TaxID=694068 RepID=UPI00044094E2|nr:uncharacterized protein FOMMEDRAFT_118567 [Fomitiporia mediterranea MF3/22]EJD05479.1 hypothetical protein FOMMEDRAFT_118567 [Fomitiporia mediterranea MF3/22]